MEKLDNENVSLDFKVQSLIKERDDVKMEYKKLFDSIKKTRYVVPTGRVVVPTSRYVVPAGKVIIIASPSRLNLVPTGRILSPGRVK
ncbi:hypothetical protein Tco_1468942 [Tanacetum coccineum]